MFDDDDQYAQSRSTGQLRTDSLAGRVEGRTIAEHDGSTAECVVMQRDGRSGRAALTVQANGLWEERPAGPSSFAL